MAFPLAALISAGGSLLSGLLGDRAAEKQNRQQTRAIQAANRRAEEREDSRVQRLVQDARAAGIHPLAALGSSVAGSFATPQAAFGGAPISGSAIGDAIKNFGASMPEPDSNAGLQKKLLQAQIRNVDASTAQLLADATSRTKVSALADATRGGGVTDTRMFGLDVKASPAFSDVGGGIQQRYGEPAEWFMFPFVALADAYKSSGTSWREAVERARQDVQETMRRRGYTAQ